MSLVVSDLRVERGRRAVLRDVAFQADPGRILVVMGPNGAGKTTLLAAIAGSLRPTKGDVTFNGEMLSALKPELLAMRRASMAQDFDCPFAYSVEDIVSLGRLCHAGTARAGQDHAAVSAALACADLMPLARRAVTTLSGGERQRVAFAKAVAQLFDRAAHGEPHLLILDEPVSSLDPEHQHRLLQQARMMAQGGATVLVTLHDLTLASIYGDDVLVLDRGGIAAHGPMSQTLSVGLIRQVFKVRIGTAPQAAGTSVLHAIAQHKDEAA